MCEISPVATYTKDSPRTCSKGEQQPSLNTGESSFNMEEKVESLPSTSNDYLYYGQRVGEMEENAKSQNGSYKTLSISILDLNERHV